MSSGLKRLLHFFSVSAYPTMTSPSTLVVPSTREEGTASAATIFFFFLFSLLYFRYFLFTLLRRRARRCRCRGVRLLLLLLLLSLDSLSFSVFAPIHSLTGRRTRFRLLPLTTSRGVRNSHVQLVILVVSESLCLQPFFSPLTRLPGIIIRVLEYYLYTVGKYQEKKKKPPSACRAVGPSQSKVQAR